MSHAAGVEPQTKLTFALTIGSVKYIFTSMHSGVGSGTRTEDDYSDPESPWIPRKPGKSQTQLLVLVRPISRDMSLWGLRQEFIDSKTKDEMIFEILNANMQTIAYFELHNAYLCRRSPKLT
jgi:hypothetical protein